MPLHRRDFMKVLGISVASLYLARCRPKTTQATPGPDDWIGCYEPTEPPKIETPQPTTAAARERLHLYWLRFDELARRTQAEDNDQFGEALIADHRAVLDQLVTNGEISAPAADLLQEAYTAAVYHIQALNSGVTCYEMPWVDYTPDSARVLVEQSQVLNQIAEGGTIDPVTLAKAQTALEHDMAFYVLTDAEVDALYSKIHEKLQGMEVQPDYPPPFEDLPLELTPETKEATQFLMELLTRK